MIVANEGTKTYFAGTHRVRPPAETLAWIRPRLAGFGITRVADVTWLDDIGIPVYQAVRPNARTLSVSQGKGLDHDSAKVSAVMESIELWHAERLERPDTLVATPEEVADDLGYAPAELALHPRHCLNPGTRIEWWPARRLADGAESLVPFDCLDLDGRVRPRWRPPVFLSSSSGLASGNTTAEAVLHALYEVVERDAISRAQRAGAGRVVDPATIHGRARDLLERFAAADVRVRMELLPTPVGTPCFGVVIWSESFPVPFTGHGCHSDREVALCRALTEAAQSRVTVIAGARDDVGATQYQRARNVRFGMRPAPRSAAPAPAPSVDFQTIPSADLPDLDEEIETAVRRVVAATGRSPLVVEHTRADVGVPVARVVCPGLDFPGHP